MLRQHDAINFRSSTKQARRVTSFLALMYPTGATKLEDVMARRWPYSSRWMNILRRLDERWENLLDTLAEDMLGTPRQGISGGHAFEMCISTAS